MGCKRCTNSLKRNFSAVPLLHRAEVTLAFQGAFFALLASYPPYLR